MREGGGGGGGGRWEGRRGFSDMWTDFQTDRDVKRETDRQTDVKIIRHTAGEMDNYKITIRDREIWIDISTHEDSYIDRYVDRQGD